MRHSSKISFVAALAAVFSMLFANFAYASSVAVVVVDITAPVNAVAVEAGGVAAPITINYSVTGSQDGTATFEVYRDWILTSTGWVGSNAKEFTVAPRAGGDPASTGSVSGTVAAAADAPVSSTASTLIVSVFDITNSNTSGGKLSAGSSGSYLVTVTAPAKQNQTITFAEPTSPRSYGETFSVSPTSSSGLTVSLGAAGSCSLAGSIVTMTNSTGVCTLTASQAGNDDYNAATNVVRTVTAQKRAASVTPNAAGKTYGAADPALTGTLNGFLAGDNVTATYSRTAGEDAGVYTISATTAPNTALTHYDVTLNTASFTIGKAATTTTVTCTDGPFTYSGSAHTPCTARTTGANGLDVTPTVHYTNNIGAGTATATASYTATDNYAASSDSETFAIGKAETTTTVTCEPGPFTYNGAAHTPCTATVTGADLNVSRPVSYTNNVNAGTATAAASFTETANYAASGDSEEFTIRKAPTTTTVTCTGGPFTYTGSAHTPCTALTTGANNLSVAPDVDYTNNTGAGTATAAASFAGNDNYAASNGSETFSIAKAPTTTTVTCTDGPFTYTGSAHTPCTARTTGANGLDVTPTVNYTNNTGAGTATAAASYAATDNYAASSGSETFDIDKAATTTTVVCSATVTFTGSPQTPCVAQVDGPGFNAPMPLSVVYSDNTDAGTAGATAAYAGGANHLGSDDSETFTINKAPTTTAVTCTTGPFTFNGSAHTPCSATTTGVNDLSVTQTVAYTDNVDAGTATASASFAETGNYLGSSDSETFDIAKAATTTTVTCATGPFIFNGSAYTPCSASVSGPAGLSEPLAVSYTNNTMPGTAGASAAYDGAGNYLGSSDSETFAIGSWTTRGFFSPVDMNGILNTVKGGSTVPLKFEAFAGAAPAAEINTVSGLLGATIKQAKVACDGSNPTDEIETVASGSTSLRYDSTAGHFIYNWKTPTTVGCYKATVTLGDGTTIAALFKVR